MDRTDAAGEVADVVAKYIARFNADDFEGALECYRLPFTWFFGTKAATVSTREEFLDSMRKTKAALVAKGLSHSELLKTTVRMLGKHGALAGVEVTRRMVDGSEPQATSATYLLHHDGIAWRLAANAMHPVEDTIPGTVI